MSALTPLNNKKMDKLLEKLFDLKRIPSKLLLIFCIISAFVLFAPKGFIERLYLNDFKKQYGLYIGITFLGSLSFLIAALFTYLGKRYTQQKNIEKVKKRILNTIRHLDFHEKALLREFYINNKRTLQLPMDNDTVSGLVNNNIIYQVSATGFQYVHGIYYSFSITEYANEHLSFDLIDLPANPTKSEKSIILAQRPTWAIERSRIENRFNSRW
ncbi:super-infection exclusion protein B [Filimonas effusa]|uniref:Superinfection exclusion protein B n=1 Tax=Filimonas effusa TaxID=2508721 RepID=A0A4V1MAS2_9BACT|nr:super-infection exclusion protein B [Filimonas effusa]RXK86866.1 hypothetical protein ESB13_08765 [Filimonas effusa]